MAVKAFVNEPTQNFVPGWFLESLSLSAALCLHFAYYNFCRIHQSLRVTPALEPGVTDRVGSPRNLLKFTR